MNFNENSNSNAKETKESPWADPNTPHLSGMIDLGVSDPAQDLNGPADA